MEEGRKRWKGERLGKISKRNKGLKGGRKRTGGLVKLLEVYRNSFGFCILTPFSIQLGVTRVRFDFSTPSQTAFLSSENPYGLLRKPGGFETIT